MKHSNNLSVISKKSNRPKTPLESYRLFFEEIPLETSHQPNRVAIVTKNRLKRKSKLR